MHQTCRHKHKLNLVVSVEVDDAGDRGPVVLHVPEVPPEVAVLPVCILCVMLDTVAVAVPLHLMRV